MRFLLDTNVVINYLEASLPKDSMLLLNTIVDEKPIISIITKIETLGYDFKTHDEQIVMETFINACSIININNDIVDKTISIKKAKKIKLPDAIIAATALLNNLVLLSRNLADFKSIEELDVTDPYNFKNFNNRADL